MSIKRGRDLHGPYYRFGNGKKYYYTAGDIVSRRGAKLHARRQMMAISRKK